MATLLFRLLLMAYPASLRRAHGVEMRAAVATRWRDTRGIAARLRFIRDLFVDFFGSWPREWRTARTGGQPRPEPRSSGRGGLTSDAKAAFRLVTRAPIFCAGAVLTLALGIGAGTAIFSLADATLLHPLPVRNVDRILQGDFSWSRPDFLDLEASQHVFSSMAAWSNQDVGMSQDGATLQLASTVVSGGYFNLVGLQPLAGRLLDASDDRPGAPVTTVLSERLWQRTFASNPRIIGSTIAINQKPVIVVGIAPRHFRGLSLRSAPDLYLPIASLSQIGTGAAARPAMMTSRDLVWLQIAGRLTDGVAPEQARAAVEGMYRRVHPPQDASEAAEKITLTPLLAHALGMSAADDLRRFITMLAAATALTLLLACATVANLMIVRSQQREREFAVRAALGADRGRLARLLVAEGLVIGSAGTLAAIVVARMTLSLLATYQLPASVAVGDLDLSLSPAILFGSAALGVLTCVAFSLAPVVVAGRRALSGTLRDGSRGSARQPMRAMLVAIQVGLCVLLLGGSLAFGRALRHALASDLGFNVRETSIVSIDPRMVRYTRPQTIAFQQHVLDSLRGQPWVSAASWSVMRPLKGMMRWSIGLPNSTQGKHNAISVNANVVSDGYFESMGIPLESGRGFSPQDATGGPGVTVLSASVARTYFPEGNALGQLVATDPAYPKKGLTVVGIAGDVSRDVDAPRMPMFYVPISQASDMLDFGGQTLIVRSTLAPESALRQTLALMKSVDATVPVVKAETMGEHVDEVLMATRLGLMLFTLFATLAVVLTTLGIYAVVAYAIAHRTREIGIRVALGAAPGGVLGLVARQGLLPVGGGLVMGLLAFRLSAAGIDRFMFSLPASNAATLVALTGLIGLCALVAMLVPAQRALRVNPVIALRNE